MEIVPIKTSPKPTNKCQCGGIYVDAEQTTGFYPWQVLVCNQCGNWRNLDKERDPEAWTARLEEQRKKLQKALHPGRPTTGDGLKEEREQTWTPSHFYRAKHKVKNWTQTDSSGAVTTPLEQVNASFNLEAALQRRRRGSPSSVGEIEPAIVGKDWKKHKKLDTRLLPVHRYTEAQAQYTGVSKTYQTCQLAKHQTFRHSPDGFDTIVECPVCCMAWLIKGVTGEQIRLEGSSYERRLIEQKTEQPSKSPYPAEKMASADYKPGDPVDVRETLMSGGQPNTRPNYRSWVRGYKFVRRASPGVPFSGTMNPHNPDGAPQGHIIVSGPVVGGEGEVRYDENDVRPAELRAVKVWFSDGNHLVTNMAKGITDREIRDYYAVGRTFNVGGDPEGQEDNLVKVTRIEILDSDPLKASAQIQGNKRLENAIREAIDALILRANQIPFAGVMTNEIHLQIEKITFDIVSAVTKKYNLTEQEKNQLLLSIHASCQTSSPENN